MTDPRSLLEEGGAQFQTMGYPSPRWWGGSPRWGVRLSWCTPWRGMGYLSLTKTGSGYPPKPGNGVPPETEQQSEYLLHGGRYAFCVHGGGLSCVRALVCILSSLSADKRTKPGTPKKSSRNELLCRNCATILCYSRD